MNRISRNLGIVYKTERLIAQRRFAVLQTRLILFGLAGLVGLVALLFINGAIYFLLTEYFSQAGSAAVLAVGNLVLMVGLAFAATRINVETELAPAIEVRDMAIADLEADVAQATESLQSVANSVHSLRSDPLAALAQSVLPVLLSNLRKKK